MTDAINITVTDHGVRKVLQKIVRKFANTKPAMKLLGEVALESIQTNFEVGGRYGFSPGTDRFTGGTRKWQALHWKTIAQRKRLGYWHSASNTGQILVRRGRQGGLLGSISYAAENDKVTVGANKKYDSGASAASLHFGTLVSDTGTRLPARPFMVIQDEDWDEMRASLGDWLMAR